MLNELGDPVTHVLNVSEPRPAHGSPSTACLKIRLVGVVEIGLEVTEHRRQWIEPVVGNRDRLRIAQLRECFHIEAIVALLLVVFDVVRLVLLD
jgi:hypothetical protein